MGGCWLWRDLRREHMLGYNIYELDVGYHEELVSDKATINCKTFCMHGGVCACGLSFGKAEGHRVRMRMLKLFNSEGTPKGSTVACDLSDSDLDSDDGTARPLCTHSLRAEIALVA